MFATIGLLLWLAQDAIRSCGCDPNQPATLEERTCSLTKEAVKQASTAEPVFFLKDINPRKANRTLALPRKTAKGAYTLDHYSAQERTELWTAAIAKAKSLWGDNWAVAYNGDKVRTQCQVHIHIGKLNTAAKLSKFSVVSRPSQIPAPQGAGIWIYSQGGKLRVHTGEQITETALVR
ncbi:MAG: hypothetical protein NTZ56_19830 [Acidobacteria bacterium]|nr:hypothetical protein [Acidobacteriota bacterium]